MNYSNKNDFPRKIIVINLAKKKKMAMIFKYLICLEILISFSLSENVIKDLYKVSKDTLVSIAKVSEKYYREKMHINPDLPGLSKYINQLQEIEIVDFILSEIKANPELTYEKYVELGVTFVEYQNVTIETAISIFPTYVLRSLLLTCEKYENEKNEFKMFGGLQNYINTLSRENIVEFLLSYMNRYYDLDNMDKVFYQAFKYGYFDYNQERKILEGTLPMQSMETLRILALTCSQYLQESNGSYLFNTLINYITNFSREQLIDYITKVVSEHFYDLNSLEKIATLAENYGVQDIPMIGQIGGLEDYIYRMSLYTLRIWGITCEKYYNATFGEVEESILSRIDTLTKNQLIDIIVGYADKYYELSSYIKLNKLSEEYGIKYGETEFINSINELTDKNTLIMYSLTVEKYSLEKKNKYILNRLNSYASKLDSFFLKNYILLICEKYTDIQQIGELNSLSSKYGFDSKATPIYENIKVLNNLINSSVEELRKYAKTCEDYSREQNKLSYLGDITDYSETLSKIDLLHYLIYMIGNYPTLDDLEVLNSFEKGKDFDWPSFKKDLDAFELTTLRDMTTVLLKYHRECLKQAYFKGISELVSPLNKEQLISEIVNVIKEHQELRDKDRINALLEKYGYPPLED